MKRQPLGRGGGAKVYGALTLLVLTVLLLLFVLPRFAKLTIPPLPEVEPPPPPPPVDTCARVRKFVNVAETYYDEAIVMEYGLCREDSLASVLNRIDPNGARLQSPPDITGYYRQLRDHDSPTIIPYVKALRATGERLALSPAELIELALRQVQERQYTLVHLGSCQSIYAGAKEKWWFMPKDFLEKYHLDADMSYPPLKRPKNRCVENAERAGVLGPFEFAYHHNGDCDTRTVFLHTVYAQLGISSVVLNSDRIGHSVLGVAGIPAQGTAIYIDPSSGQRYVVCETTTSMPPGVFPDYNPRDWYIALRP